MTGRNSCPPAWVTQLEQLTAALGAHRAAAWLGVPLLPFSEPQGKGHGFAGVVYDGVSQQVHVLKFDSHMQPLPAASQTFALNTPSALGSEHRPQAQHFQIAVEKVFVLPFGASVPREGRRITVRDAAHTVVAEMLVDSALLHPLPGLVVAYPCAA